MVSSMKGATRSPRWSNTSTHGLAAGLQDLFERLQMVVAVRQDGNLRHV